MLTWGMDNLVANTAYLKAQEAAYRQKLFRQYPVEPPSMSMRCRPAFFEMTDMSDWNGPWPRGQQNDKAVDKPSLREVLCGLVGPGLQYLRDGGRVHAVQRSREQKEKGRKEVCSAALQTTSLRGSTIFFDAVTKDIIQQFLKKDRGALWASRTTWRTPGSMNGFKLINFPRLEAGLVEPPMVPKPNVDPNMKESSAGGGGGEGKSGTCIML
ncbi:unnamed protein product [Boreogadus saida]